MAEQTFEEEIRRLLDEWNRSLLEKDAAAAARFREDGYTAALPDRDVLTKEEELALIASPDYTVESISTRNVEVRGGRGEATAVFDSLIEGEFRGERIDGLYRCALSLRKTGGVWRALSSRVAVEDAPESRPGGRAAGAASAHRREESADASGAASALGRLVPRKLKSLLKGVVNGTAHEPASAGLLYIPYKSGQDFVIPPPAPKSRPARGRNCRFRRRSYGWVTTTRPTAGPTPTRCWR